MQAVAVAVTCIVPSLCLGKGSMGYFIHLSTEMKKISISIIFHGYIILGSQFPL